MSDLQSSNNVIQFPFNNKSQLSVTNQEDYEEKSNLLQRLICEELALSVFEEAMTKLAISSGVDFEEYPQDVGLLFESIRAIQYRIHGLHHELHEVADTFYEEYEYTDPSEFEYDYNEDENEEGE